jgi:hypothetical protein
MKAAVAEIHRLAGTEFNVNSTKALGEVLFERLKIQEAAGVKRVRRTQTGFATDAATLEEHYGDLPIVQKLLEYREVQKLAGTYLEPLPTYVNPRTGRVHGSFSQVSAGRAPRVERPEPPEHPGPHGARTGAARAFRAAREGCARRVGAAVRGLQPGRAQDPRAPVRRPGAREGLRGGQGHPHGDRGDGVRRDARAREPRDAEPREGDQLRPPVRDGPGAACAGHGALGARGEAVHREVLPELPEGARLDRLDAREGEERGLRRDAAR